MADEKMTDKRDPVTPRPRALYARPGFTGAWYTDIAGQGRCSSEWIGPCQFCHRRLPEAKRRAQAAELQADRIADSSIVTARDFGGLVRMLQPGEVVEQVEASATAHGAVVEEVAEQQYVYQYLIEEER